MAADDPLAKVQDATAAWVRMTGSNSWLSSEIGVDVDGVSYMVIIETLETYEREKRWRGRHDERVATIAAEIQEG